jgi:hypothetical protein
MSEVGRPRPQRPGWLYRWMMGLMGLCERLLFMSCRSFIQLTSARYERPLRSAERMRHAMHRAICRICRIQERRMAQLRTLARGLGQHGMDESDATLSPEAIARMRHAMAQAAARSGPGDAPKA